ncbi:MAG TPA: 2TM domain-containing protein [Thermomicrobiales bacterium]|nr:2TM domain-containing protein [Thermomicrobiales bacterium]
MEYGRTTTSNLKQVFFWMHCALFTGINSVLFVINMLVDRSNPWFLYPLWGWGMVLAFQAGFTYPWRGWFGAHLAATVVLLAGLTGINIVFGDGPWVIWVLLALGIPLLAHALYVFRRATLFQSQAIASVLWFAMIVYVQFHYDGVWWSSLLSILTSGSVFMGLLMLHRTFRHYLPERYDDPLTR